MRARMLIAHRASRFGDHMLLPGQIIATGEDEGFKVSGDEMTHHLNAGNATALEVAPETTKLPDPETTAKSTAVRDETATANGPAKRRRKPPKK